MSVKRGFVLLAVCMVLVLWQPVGRSQSDTAAVTGRVVDPTNATVPGATIIVLNVETQIVSKTSANEQGLFTVSGLPPGSYRIEASKLGFKTVIKPDVVLHLQDVVAINFVMILGSITESVTVEGGASIINTTDGSVSTVVDRSYMQNMPLNGRSLQDLILLTPGVVTNTPQQASTIGGSIPGGGEFSVNGQRTESNYYTVDGVSANTGIAPGDVGPGQSGSLTAATALGTTQALASVDSLQEFRVLSSTYSAEYGRNPGGQFSFVTRSGANEWHGTAFDYLRNDYFDANNWFNDYYGQHEPPLRQNDFGGALGGPVEIPKVYSGKSKTFFFFSYEGLRVVQPQAATVNYVPTVALRQATPPALREAINAFPQPTIGRPDLGNGLTEFIDTWSNPSSLDAYSVRLDHSFRDRIKIFFRFSNTPSSATARLTGNYGTPSTRTSFDYHTRTYTFGVTSPVSNRVSTDLRLNYTSSLARSSYRLDDFGGAQSVDLAQLQGINSTSNVYFLAVGLFFSGNYAPELYQGGSFGTQAQWNLTNSWNVSSGAHQLKFGVDYRRLAPITKPAGTVVYYYFFDDNEVRANNPGIADAQNFSSAYPLYRNFSAFAQDQWRIGPRFSLSAGVRWEVNPAPSVTQGMLPYTVQGAGDLSTMRLAPQGTPLWETTWHNFAPRFGAAYILGNSPNHETVMRGGVGLFFDTGQQLGSLGFLGPGFTADNSLGFFYGAPVSFPIPMSDVPAIASKPSPPYPTVYAYPTHLQLPYTLQWNVTVEKALGKSQALSIAYVSSHAARLLEANEIYVRPSNSNFNFVVLFQNGLTADYNSLQLQYQRRISKGFTALASYTYSHAIDYGSQNFSFPYVRGNSNFDVRHNFSSAFSYDVPQMFENRVARALLHHWGVDDRFSARTAFPITLNGVTAIDPATGGAFKQGADVVPGVPLYLNGSQYPGGRTINPAAFTIPPYPQPGNAPRNFLRGFGAWQMDLAVRREFPIHERIKLQFRTDVFNIFNHPNFGAVNPNVGQATFGQATATLNTSLGTLNPLYQMGGPRSMQLALRLSF